MLFVHTLDKVLSGEKRQTRRLVKPGQGLYAGAMDMVLDAKGRHLYYVGQTLAIQPGRGKAAVARLRITDIRREDVRDISDEDAIAEGFKSYREFLALWVRMHDPRWWMPKKNNDANLAYSYHRHMMGFTFLKERPADRYQAWALTFCLVTP